MKILNQSQIQEADRQTIRMEPIESIDLMERAAKTCFKWICQRYNMDQKLTWFNSKLKSGIKSWALHGHGFIVLQMDVGSFFAFVLWLAGVLEGPGNISNDFRRCWERVFLFNSVFFASPFDILPIISFAFF